MHYRHVGTAGIQVSSIALGGWINFGASKMEGGTAQEIVKTAYDQGINYFDLADVYARGEAEQQMGAMLQQFPRHTLVIATKVFWPMSDDVNDRGLSRKHIMASIDASLKRLGTDHIDLYFCHRADPATPLTETIRAMDDLIHQGKILYWGTSEWSGEQIAAAYDLAQQHGWYPPTVEQSQYSLLHRQRVEDEIVPVTEPRGMGLVAFSPLAQGMLTGKYDDGLPQDSRFAKEEWARDRFLNDANQAKTRNLKAVADDLGVTRGQLALAWVLCQPGVSSVITGATVASQVAENVKASDLTLTPDVLTRLDAIMAGE
jgi:voltage-dependent potassium channel beta subunit